MLTFTEHAIHNLTLTCKQEHLFTYAICVAFTCKDRAIVSQQQNDETICLSLFCAITLGISIKMEEELLFMLFI